MDEVTWKPIYDLHAISLDGKTSSEVSLIYCANVTQSTGEDWNNVNLTLNTASSQARRHLSVPAVQPIRCVTKEQFPQAPTPIFDSGVSQTHLRNPLLQRDSDAMRYMFRPTNAIAAPAPVGQFHERVRSTTFATPDQSPHIPSFLTADTGTEWESTGTALDRHPLSTMYNVKGPVSVLSDRVAHRFAVAALGFTAELRYVCAPRKSSAAFIEARIKNTSEYELLPGPVSVFMDEGFVTQTSLGVSMSLTSLTCDTNNRHHSLVVDPGEPEFRLCTRHRQRRARLTQHHVQHDTRASAQLRGPIKDNDAHGDHHSD